MKLRDAVCILMIVLVALIALSLLKNQLNIGLDDSDRDGWHRSGMKVLVDHKTGVQYLSDGRGGLS